MCVVPCVKKRMFNPIDRPTRRMTSGTPWLAELYDHFAPVREEIPERGIAEQEVDTDIDAAVTAARTHRRADGA
jgi:hypothetical protein